MRDADKSSNHKSSGHHHNNKHNSSKGGNGGTTNNNAAVFADVKAEASRGLELLDKIVNDAAQVKWILKNVLTNVTELESSTSKPQKCQTCTTNSSSNSTPHHSKKDQKEPHSSPSKEKRDKKAKKAVLPMVSGHTVQRPSINITRVDSVQRREGSSAPEQAPVAEVPRRRPGPSSRTRPEASAAIKRKNSNEDERAGNKERRGSREIERRRDSKGKKRVAVSSSSSSSSSGSRKRSKSSSSSSSSSGSSSSSSSRSRSRKGSTVGSLMSVGRGKSPPKKKQPPQSSTPTPRSPQQQQQHHPHGSASSRFLSSTANISAMKKKYITRTVKVNLTDVQKLIGNRKHVKLSDYEEQQVQVYWRGWKKPKIQPPPRRESVKVPEEDPEYRPPTPKLPAKKMIGPKSRMIAAAKARVEAEGEVKPRVVTTTAEMLRAKLREKFNKFKLTKLNAGAGESSNQQTMPDSTTNSVKTDANKSDTGASGSGAGHQELAAIGLSVFVSAGEKKSHESLDEVVGKGMQNNTAELLELKRDQWILMQNNKTGISSLKEDVNKGLKKVVGWGTDDDEGERDESGQYIVGNFYFIARETHPLALMRYTGSTDLPPCATEDSNDEPSPPPGFINVDLSSLTSIQISQLQKLGNEKGSRRPSQTSDDGLRSIKNENVSDEDDDDDDEDEQPIRVPDNLQKVVAGFDSDSSYD